MIPKVLQPLCLRHGGARKLVRRRPETVIASFLLMPSHGVVQDFFVAMTGHWGNASGATD
jgi:hypothetical protein